MAAQEPSGKRLAFAYRIILCLSATTISLAGVVGFLVFGGLRTPSWNALLADDEHKREAVGILVERGSGIWDSFPDADVARVLQPNLDEREATGGRVSSNKYGLRERSFDIPKPKGVTRIVILGDSFVFGSGVSESDRVGVFLQQFLQDKASGRAGEIECLHIGLGGWNTINECAFVRRQLSLLQPDLVVQVTVGNDLDDGWGIRGFGSHGWYPPRHPERGDTLISLNYARRLLGAPTFGYLNDALDYESRHRFDQASTKIARLAHEVDKLGGQYLLLIQWHGPTGTLFARGLEPDQFAFVGRHIWGEPMYWVSEADKHWNRAGHQAIATLIYGLIQERDLLPGLQPSAWDEASAAVQESHRYALTNSNETVGRRDRGEDARSNIVFGTESSEGMVQVHGGIDHQGYVAPYASMLLKRRDGARLRIVGSALARPELDGVHVQVFVDEFPVGTLMPTASEAIDFTCELPLEARSRPFVSIRLQADDYVYRANNLRRCIVFKLEEIALVP